MKPKNNCFIGLHNDELANRELKFECKTMHHAAKSQIFQPELNNVRKSAGALNFEVGNFYTKLIVLTAQMNASRKKECSRMLESFQLLIN